MERDGHGWTRSQDITQGFGPEHSAFYERLVLMCLRAGALVTRCLILHQLNTSLNHIYHFHVCFLTGIYPGKYYSGTGLGCVQHLKSISCSTQMLNWDIAANSASIHLELPGTTVLIINHWASSVETWNCNHLSSSVCQKYIFKRNACRISLFYFCRYLLAFSFRRLIPECENLSSQWTNHLHFKPAHLQRTRQPSVLTMLSRLTGV